MKKCTLFLLTFGLIMALVSSCKKEEPAPTNPGTTAWNWSGTVPFSVKVDGVSYVVPLSDISVIVILGYLNINAHLTPDLDLALSLQSAITVGEYTTPSPNNFTYTNQISGYQGGAINNAGKIKIIQKTATLIEGKFYGTVASPSSTETHVVTEGYFKVDI